MDFLPIFLNVQKQPCIVIGGGEVAARKAGLLEKANATITVISPSLCDRLQSMAEVGTINHRPKDYSEEDLENAVLVIAATDSEEVNRLVADAARRKGIPVNVVNDPVMGNFIMPSVIDFYQNQRLCVVHRGVIEDKVFLCSNCNVFYCLKCREALIEMENKCWNCDATIEKAVIESSKIKATPIAADSREDTAIIDDTTAEPTLPKTRKEE